MRDLGPRSASRRRLGDQRGRAARRTATTGRRCRVKRWPGAPSERPRTSSRTTSACTVAAVPPMVNAVTPEIRGRRACRSAGPVVRLAARGTAASRRAAGRSIDARGRRARAGRRRRPVEPAGVVAVDLARRSSPSPVHASQTSGGSRGSTPTPPTGQSSRSSTAHDGHGRRTARSAARRRAPAASAKQANAAPRPSAPVVSVGGSPVAR